jgi:hypothetical protein
MAFILREGRRLRRPDRPFTQVGIRPQEAIVKLNHDASWPSVVDCSRAGMSLNLSIRKLPDPVTALIP